VVDGAFRRVLERDVIAESSQQGVDVVLETPGGLTRPLQLDERWPAAWDEHQAVRPSASAMQVQLEVHESHAVEPPHEAAFSCGLERP